MNAQSVDTRFIYVGTFTGVDDHGGGAEGIYVCRMDMTTGAVELVHTVPGVPNPSFLTLHPERPLLYAVNAVPEIDGHAGGTVSAFAVDRTTGALTFLNRQPSQGPGPCHVSVEQTGRYVNHRKLPGWQRGHAADCRRRELGLSDGLGAACRLQREPGSSRRAARAFLHARSGE